MGEAVDGNAHWGHSDQGITAGSGQLTTPMANVCGRTIRQFNARGLQSIVASVSQVKGQARREANRCREVAIRADSTASPKASHEQI